MLISCILDIKEHLPTFNLSLVYNHLNNIVTKREMNPEMKYIATILLCIFCSIAKVESLHGRSRDENDNWNVKSHGSGDTASSNRMRLLADVNSIDIFALTIAVGPTAQPLMQFQIDQLIDTIENVLLTQLSGSNDASLRLVSSVKLGEMTSSIHTPSERIDEWRTRMGKTQLSFSKGVAAMDFSTNQDPPKPVYLANAITGIIDQDLKSAIRASVDDLEWITMVDVEMNVPDTPPPTAAPTKSPTKVPTTQRPTAFPTKAPVTQSPTTSPTKAPTSAPTKLPSLKPTPFPTKFPTSSPVVITQSPSEMENIGGNGNDDEDDDDDNGPSTPIIAPTLGAASGVLVMIGALLMRKKKGGGKGDNGDNGCFKKDGSGDGESSLTQTPDSVDGKIARRGMQLCYDVTSVRKLEPFEYPPMSRNTGEILYDLEKDTDPSDRQFKGIYAPVQISSVDRTKREFDEMSSFVRCESLSSGTASAESFEITKSLDLSPVRKGILASPFEVVPGNSVYCNGELKERKSCLESAIFCAAFEPIDDFDELDSALLESEKDFLDNEGGTRSFIRGRRNRTTSRSASRSTSRSLSQSYRLSRGQSHISASDGEVSEFLLDTSWDPDDADGASDAPSFDAPQFEPLFEPEDSDIDSALDMV